MYVRANQPGRSGPNDGPIDQDMIRIFGLDDNFVAPPSPGASGPSSGAAAADARGLSRGYVSN